VGVTAPVCSQITGASAKADWPSVETMDRRDADRQERPEGWCPEGPHVAPRGL